jgi:hypothetical protein
VSTLNELLQSGATSNPALNKLLDDYAKYHVVVAAVGGLFLISFTVLGIASWQRFRAAPRSDHRGWTFEKRSYFSFSALSAAVGLMLAITVTANAGTALSPRQGFSGVVNMIGTPQPGGETDGLHEAFNNWLGSGSAEMPPLIQARIDDRIGWQRPKAIVCGALLALLAALSHRIWRTRINRSRQDRTPQRGGRSLRAAGFSTVSACLLLMLMVLGNTAGSLAPIAMTLVFG